MSFGIHRIVLSRIPARSAFHVDRRIANRREHVRHQIPLRPSPRSPQSDKRLLNPVLRQIRTPRNRQRQRIQPLPMVVINLFQRPSHAESFPPCFYILHTHHPHFCASNSNFPQTQSEPDRVDPDKPQSLHPLPQPKASRLVSSRFLLHFAIPSATPINPNPTPPERTDQPAPPAHAKSGSPAPERNQIPRDASTSPECPTPE